VEALDRYLEAVRGYLPRAQRADIVAELAEDLRSEIEEQRWINLTCLVTLLVIGIFCLIRVVQQARRAFGHGPQVKA
jgi:hypothetical protein